MGAEKAGEQASKRSTKRSRVLLRATLQTPRGGLDARLRDLSCKGALVECDARLAMDEEVVFVRGGTSVPARVAWLGGNRAGLEFLQPIEESEVLVHVDRRVSAPPPPPQPQTPYRRPGFIKGLTDYDKELAREVGALLGVNLVDD
jgi:hypothetical protein